MSRRRWDGDRRYETRHRPGSASPTRCGCQPLDRFGSKGGLADAAWTTKGDYLPWLEVGHEFGQFFLPILEVGCGLRQINRRSKLGRLLGIIGLDYLKPDVPTGRQIVGINRSRGQFRQ